MKREAYLDLLRLLAILAVIFMHVSSRIQPYYPDSTIDYLFTESVNTITRFAVPLFVMISGSLMLGRDLQYKNICHRIIHYMTVFLSWSFLYTLVLNFQYIKSYSFSGLIINTLLDTITGHFHFWFLFLISGLYLTIPYLDILLKNLSPSMVHRYVFISLLVCFVPTTILSIRGIDNYLGSHYNSFNVGFFGGYLLYFICGYLLKAVKLKNIRNAFIITTLALLYTVSMTIIGDKTGIINIVGVRDGITVNVFVATIGIFLITKSVPLIYNNKWKSLLQTMSKLSFGAYLVHMLIISILELPIMNLNLNCFSTLLVYSCSVTVFSFSLSYIITKIKILKWLVS